MKLAIATHGLCKSLGGREVVRGIDLSVPTGCVYGFLGPNGCGKTTSMRLILGLMKPDSGTIEIFGESMADNRLAILRRVGSFIESPALYEHLTGRANLELVRRLLGLPKQETGRVLELVDMTKDADRRVGTFSLGMRQRLALARTLLGKPRLLMLDEPTNGLDPDGIADMRALIRELPRRLDCTVFLSSHLLSEVEQVADHVGLLHGGKLLRQGDLDPMLAGGSRIRIATSDPLRALAVLRREGWQVEQGENASLVLRPSSDEGAADCAARANRRLLEAGIEVSALERQRLTLEDLYRDTFSTSDTCIDERIAA